jgi:hypothetical protein
VKSAARQPQAGRRGGKAKSGFQVETEGLPEPSASQFITVQGDKETDDRVACGSPTD